MTERTVLSVTVHVCAFVEGRMPCSFCSALWPHAGHLGTLFLARARNRGKKHARGTTTRLDRSKLASPLDPPTLRPVIAYELLLTRLLPHTAPGLCGLTSTEVDFWQPITCAKRTGVPVPMWVRGQRPFRPVRRAFRPGGVLSPISFDAKRNGVAGARKAQGVWIQNTRSEKDRKQSFLRSERKAFTGRRR